MNIIISKEEPYAVLIEQYIAQQFPLLTTITGENLVDVLTTILIGNKDTRFGPTKSPESLVVIRNVIRNAVADQQPIQILMPWGSMKSDQTDHIDMAELLAISTLIKLSEAVKRVYKPGIYIRIRIEDYSGVQLFSYPKTLDMVTAGIINNYCNKLENLIEILGGNDVIEPIRESNMNKVNEFYLTVNNLKPYFVDYLSKTNDVIAENPLFNPIDYDSYNELKAFGWNGIISSEQRQYYYNTYKKLYNSDQEEAIELLSLYLAQSLSRRILNMNGAGKWKEYIQLTFCAPVPGIPSGFDHNYIYYRTVPISQARTHICPWRAMGYLRIYRDKVCSKICSLAEYREKELIPSSFTLSNNDFSVEIDSSYILVD